MNPSVIHKTLNYCLAAIWILNGLCCKILNLVPRHELIVARILGDAHSRLMTILIGVSEIGMAIWIASGRYSMLNAIVQISIILTMNIIEFVLAPDLLLWGKLNAIFAVILSIIIYINGFYLRNNKKIRYA